MSSSATYCRLCESRCGLHAEIEGDRLVALNPDKTDPVSQGFICDTATQSIAALTEPTRITEPMKRVDGRLTPVDWDTAIREIGATLRDIRAKQGPSAIGLYLGDAVQRSTRTLVRALAFGVGSGTPHIFSSQCMNAGPRLWAAEQLIGHPTPLISDLGRAHYVLLLSGAQRELGWGPHTAGMGHEAALQHSRKTKGTKVVVADPRATDLAASMDGHLQIRPGTEPFLMLGMLSAIVRGGWIDAQFIRDYTQGYAALEQHIAPWDVERCAAICGIEAPELSGVALKFSRSAMAVIHPAAHSFNNAAGGLGAWAWAALHAVTANLLRPGGLYENAGAFDLFGVLSQLSTDKAPKTASGGHSLLLMQAPATALASEILDGEIQALITVSGDPLGTLPGPSYSRAALDKLSTLVCITRHEDETAAQADWVLPAAHPWEQADLCLHDSVVLPIKGTVWTPPLVAPPQQARPEEAILSDLFGALRPGLRKSAWGAHFGLTARYLAQADLEQLEQRAFSWSDALDLDAVPPDARRINLGAADRSTWRPTTEDERIQLLPSSVATRLGALQAPAVEGLSLRTAQAFDRAPDAAHQSRARTGLVLRVHPELGHAAGSRMQLDTAHGSVMVTIKHDDKLRPDVLDLPAVASSAALSLLDPEAIDPLTGCPVMDGLSATLSCP
jgi:anaerobic selenocysteine-containing dehydrogenase